MNRSSEPELMSWKVCLFWQDWEGVIYYELLLYGQISIRSLLSTTKLRSVINDKGSRIGNQKRLCIPSGRQLHMLVVGRRKDRSLGRSFNNLNSPDQAPNNYYYLLLSMKNWLSDKKYSSRAAQENQLFEYRAEE